jgi:hypothetical protein
MLMLERSSLILAGYTGVYNHLFLFLNAADPGDHFGVEGAINI